jgi:hypothetical protein
MSDQARFVSGIILITIPTIQFGGLFLLSLFTRKLAGVTDNPARMRLYIAGHAHAGVLVILSLVMQPLVDQTSLEPALHWIARFGAPSAAILMPAGFFLGMNADGKFNVLRNLIYLGGLLLAASVLILGVGLVTALPTAP